MTPPAADPRRELRFALEEGHATLPPPDLLDRTIEAARRTRPAGRPLDDPERIGGADTFRRAVAAMDEALGELEDAEWAAPALRDLDVQGLLGHLIGVESAFHGALSDPPVADSGDHIGSTQPSAGAQAGREPAATLRDWQVLTSRTSVLVSAQPAERTVAFYGVELPLDQMLVIRAFEMWTHEEDVRRACGRALRPPGPAPLARMADLAVTLLPAGLARAGRARPGSAVRLVLTGPGGGAWTVALDGATRESEVVTATVVVDTTAFCRVVGSRLTEADSGAWVDGDTGVASDLFAGAAALALD